MPIPSTYVAKLAEAIYPIISSPSYAGEEDLSTIRYRAARELLENFPIEELARYRYFPVLVSETGEFLYPAYILDTAFGSYCLFLTRPNTGATYYSTLPLNLLLTLPQLGLTYYPCKIYSTQPRASFENVEKALRYVIRRVEPIFLSYVEQYPLQNIASGIVGEAANIEPLHLLYPSRRAGFTMSNIFLEPISEVKQFNSIWNLFIPDILPSLELVIVSPPALEPLVTVPSNMLETLFPRASVINVPVEARYYVPVTSRLGTLTRYLIENASIKLPLLYVETLGRKALANLERAFIEILSRYEPTIEKLETYLEPANREQADRLITDLWELAAYYPIILVPVTYDKYVNKPDLAKICKILEDVIKLIRNVEARSPVLLLQGYNS